MGIVNVTPDSFSDGGLALDAEAAARLALAHRDAGARIVDIGGESTRPGHQPVPAREEIARVVPAIAAIRSSDRDLVISVDTRKAEVAAAALAAGADFVNDVSGLADQAMAGVVATSGCSIVLMRNAPCAGDVVEAARSQLAGLLLKARTQAIPQEAVILDPGLGFGDPPGGDPDANLALLRGVRTYAHGRPVLVGASRKRFIGTLTGVKDPAARLGGSVAAAVLAAEAGAAIVRVHDVEATVQALDVAAPRSPVTSPRPR